MNCILAVKAGLKTERALSIATLGLMTVLPLAEFASRLALNKSIGGTIPAVEHLTLWITFLGAALAARSDRLLALATPNFLPKRFRSRVRMVTSTLAVAAAAALIPATFQFVRAERTIGDLVSWGIHVWMAALIMPVGALLITWRVSCSGDFEWKTRALVLAAGTALPVLFALRPEFAEWDLFPPVLALILAAAAVGMPIFAVFGGIAALWFWTSGISIAMVANDIYSLSAAPILPAIPLYALAGYILAEGGSSRRLLRALNSVVGWMPGGLAVAITLMLAFFTTLGSGVTILSLGGLMLPLLTKAKYPENISIGLVTVGGSTGLLFPPSLPVILYAIKAQIPIDQLYIGGMVPGLIMVAAVALWGAWQGWWQGAPRQTFKWREAMSSLWDAKWELAVPFLILGGIFGGFATLVEAAALTVTYALFVECIVHRDLSIVHDIPRVTVECATLVGGFLIIMGAALALNSCLLQADVPARIVEWITAEISSPALFLLILNGLLLIVGAVGETFSAIFVLVPLIASMAAPYKINPVHLGVIFLANMELGYLMPPMGANLFLSSYRFDRPLPRIWNSTLPYLALLVATILIITYFPALTLQPLHWFE